jgi:glyoxylase-like metal-dependent hydrolase (beta-lactamase superfamily II)
MSISIPIEDSYTDIIGKAQRGLSINDEALAAKSGATVAEILILKSGELHEPLLRQVAGVLGLGFNALLALAKSSYKPAPVQEPVGLAHFNTVFEDMTVNSFLVWDPSSKEAAFFDTGADGQPMLDFAASHGLQVKQIFITHTHTDHILDLDRLVKATGAHAWVCEKEPLPNAESFSPGRAFQIGGLTVETRLTSGHAVGGVTFFIPGLSQPVAIVGDSMFAGSMGGGMVSYADALRNNREQILTLPDATIICSGHGPLTTVGEQKHANPFFTA